MAIASGEEPLHNKPWTNTKYTGRKGPDGWRPEVKKQYDKLLDEGDPDAVAFQTDRDLRWNPARYDGKEGPSPTPSPPSSPGSVTSDWSPERTDQQKIWHAVSRDLEKYPPMFLMPVHFESDSCEEFTSFRKKFIASGGRFSPDVSLTRLILTKSERTKRMQMELRTIGVHAEVVEEKEDREDKCIKIVNIKWLEKSWEAGRLLPMAEHIIYRGRIVKLSADASRRQQLCVREEKLHKQRQQIFERPAARSKHDSSVRQMKLTSAEGKKSGEESIHEKEADRAVCNVDGENQAGKTYTHGKKRKRSGSD